jgi:hypothetical protein
MTHGDHDPGLGLGHDSHPHEPAGLRPAGGHGLGGHDVGLAPAFGPGGVPHAAPAAPAAGHLGASEEIGNPAEYQHYWFFEQHNGYCVPSSVTQVIEAQTGMTLHGYGVVADEARSLGITLGGPGLTLPQAQELLSGFDIPSHIDTPATAQAAVDELAGYLADGRDVILSVNASPIWYGSETADNPQAKADHALVISAINDQTGTVTLSDPGSPSGNEEQVPLQPFLDAWSASHYQMLVTDDRVGGADARAATAAVDDIEHPPGLVADVTSFITGHGAVLLPIVVGVAAAGAAAAELGKRRGGPGPRPATA